MTSPAWSRRCTCGRVAATFYCDHCQAFAMDYPGDENLVDAWKTTRMTRERAAELVEQERPVLDALAASDVRPKTALQEQVDRLAASGARTKTVTRTGKADH